MKNMTRKCEACGKDCGFIFLTPDQLMPFERFKDKGIKDARTSEGFNLFLADLKEAADAIRAEIKRYMKENPDARPEDFFVDDWTIFVNENGRTEAIDIMETSPNYTAYQRLSAMANGDASYDKPKTFEELGLKIRKK